MKAIVYTSNTGFTKKYAEILSKETGIPAFDIKDVRQKIAKIDEIIYMGWLKAGTVVGFEKAQKEYTVKAVCAVGMAPPDDKSVTAITNHHNIKNAEVFYLQGGFDMNKLHGFDKFLMKMMLIMVRASISKKEDNSDKNLTKIQMVKYIKNGVDFVSKENLEPVFTWLAKK